MAFFFGRLHSSPSNKKSRCNDEIFGIFRLGLASKSVCAIMRAANGSVAERLNAPVLKTGVGKPIVSSNLTGPASIL